MADDSQRTEPSVYNLANYLTASRLGMSIVLFVFIEVGWWIPCLALFAVAAATDWLDGVVARRHNLVSSFGRMFDPLVDKVMISGAFALLIDDANMILAPWMVVLVIAREFIVTGVRGLMEQQGIEFGADQLGKIKMVLQCGVMLALFVVLQGAQWGRLDLTANSTDQMTSTIVVVALKVSVWAMVGVTALSGIQYVGKALSKMK